MGGPTEDDPFVSADEYSETVALMGTPEQAEPEIIIERLREFLVRDLPPARSLVGVPRDGTNLLPQFGWVMPWGPAGSGKTSILVDLIFHACAGEDWLGYTIERPLRVVCVVNEGIPGGLQDKLRQKKERWHYDVESVLDNLSIFVSPWGQFTFTSEPQVAELRRYATYHDADYVVLDPLHTVAPMKGGAPGETEAFKHLLHAFGVWENIGVITAHHSNKAGMVSGDWTRHPDTVFRLEKEPKVPSSKFTLEKARPADPNELGVPVLLDWAVDSFGYTRREIETERTPIDVEYVLAEVLQRIAAESPHTSLDRLLKGIKGTDEAKRTVVLDAIQRGEIVNLAPPKKASGRQSYRLILSTGDAVPPVSDVPLFKDAENGVVEPDQNGEKASPLAAVAGDHPLTGEITANGDPYVVREPLPLAGRADSDDADNPFLT